MEEAEAKRAEIIVVQATSQELAEAQALPAHPLESNPAAVYLASLAQGSRRTMRGALDTIAGLLNHNVHDALSFPWARLRFQHTAALRAQLAQRYSAATANKMLSALRGVLKAAWRLGQMTADEYQVAIDMGRVSGETLPAGRNVATGELMALMSVCLQDERKAGTRDAALVGILYGCGLRRAEIVSLDVGSYDKAEGTLRVQGKHNKARLVPTVGGAQEALDEWLTLRGTEAGPLFVRIRKADKLLPQERLTTQAIYHILLVRAQSAGVASFSPHDLRRTFVGDLLEAGADIATVQKLAGHANVTTTARYDRRGEATKRRAAQMLHVPYFKKTR